MATLWCNGEWQDSVRASVSWMDRGLTHGLGLFETLLAVDGRPMHLDRHVSRIEKGLERLGWCLPKENLEAAMTELLQRNDLTSGRARIRLALTAGSGDLTDLSAGDDRVLWMSASELAPSQSSCRLALSLWRRNEHSPLVGLKCASYAENLIALDWARKENYDEVLFLNTSGNLCEAATANLFLVIEGIIYTPSLDSGCLPGVMRELVMEMAKEAGLTIQEESLQLDDLQRADECFLTSATRGVVGVTHFEGREIFPGPIVAQLAELWEASITQR